MKPDFQTHYPLALCFTGLAALTAALPAYADNVTLGASVAVDCTKGGLPLAANHCAGDQASALAQVRSPRVQKMLLTRVRTRDTGADTALGDYSARASFSDMLTVVPARPEWDSHVSVQIGVGMHGRMKHAVIDIDVSMSSPWQINGPASWYWNGGPLPSGVTLTKTSTGFRLDGSGLDENTWVHGGFSAGFTLPMGKPFTQTLTLTTAALADGFSDTWLQFARVRLDGIEPEYGRLVAQSGYRYPGPLMVPEPGTWALMVLGLGFVGLQRRRRRRHAAS